MNAELLEKAKDTLYDIESLAILKSDYDETKIEAVLRVAIKACAETIRARSMVYHSLADCAEGVTLVELLNRAAALAGIEDEIRALLD